jgi:predicted HicB family RNase H-like nuclease
MKQIALRMDESLHKRIGHEAVERETSVTQCIIALLEEALATSHRSAPTCQHVQKEF